MTCSGSATGTRKVIVFPEEAPITPAPVSLSRSIEASLERRSRGSTLMVKRRKTILRGGTCRSEEVWKKCSRQIGSRDNVEVAIYGRIQNRVGFGHRSPLDAVSLSQLEIRAELR